MIRIRKALVKSIIRRKAGATVVEVEYDGKVHKAINYDKLSGNISKGDIVYLNTTATYLHLGTGGYDFVIINETSGNHIEINDFDNMMKLKYTPYQINCPYCIDERDYDIGSLKGMVVIVAELHSMLSPTACTIKYIMKNKKIAYIMTDGGCLPISFSDCIDELKSKGIISSTITYGNAFGGDHEAVNIYDAIIMAKSVSGCDVAIVSMGPGSLGTGTKYGFSGIEQGHIIDCINNLKAVPVFIPRISFKDKRKRHYGISHHTLTVLSDAVCSKANVVFPNLGPEKMDYIKRQIEESGISKKHNIFFCDPSIVFEAVKFYNVNISTMGRDILDDREFFMACGAAAKYASSLMSRNI